ncbi:DUF6236 family protein [Streptomyces sp. NPDC001698]|uniref:DUF6236 family protein n=1 Tax=unclassified Streptomyces TaxID=2593676 RepID=UPI0036C53A83
MIADRWGFEPFGRAICPFHACPAFGAAKMGADSCWGDAVLERVGLYYPYVRVRDEQWIKTAALYMPKLARIVPSGYSVVDSPVVRALNDELGFVVPVDPMRIAQQLAPAFLDLLERYQPALRRWYRMTGDARDLSSGGEHPGRQDSRPYRPWSLRATPPWQRTEGGQALAELHCGEVDGRLRAALLDSGLAVQSAPRWITMDASLAWVYKYSLVEEIARAGNFSPFTDQPSAHIAHGGWDSDGLASALLGGPVAASADEDLRAVGLLALRIVTPENLADVPVEKIIRIRSKNRDLFDRFSAEVTRTVDELAEELAAVTVPEARELQVAARVEERFVEPLRELRRAMNGLRIDTAFSAADLKFSLPSMVGVGALGTIENQPVLGATVGAAFALGTLGRSAAERRRTLLNESPVAYLLSVERGLTPGTLLHRLTRRR